MIQRFIVISIPVRALARRNPACSVREPGEYLNDDEDLSLQDGARQRLSLSSDVFPTYDSRRNASSEKLALLDTAVCVSISDRGGFVVIV